MVTGIWQLGYPNFASKKTSQFSDFNNFPKKPLDIIIYNPKEAPHADLYPWAPLAATVYPIQERTV
jgi:hypothetical protein